MQGVYSYISDTNHVSRVYRAAAMLVTMYATSNSISRAECFVLEQYYFSKYVCIAQCVAAFCSSLISCFPGMLLGYLLNDFEIVPVAPVIDCITPV